MGEWFLLHDAGIVDQELGWEIVSTIDDKVILSDQFSDVFRGNKQLVSVDFYIRVHLCDGFLGRLYLWLAYILCAVNDLTL